VLLVDIISTRASSCASSDSGTCTAIWSPSKSALNAAQTNGCSWIALPSIRTGSNAWMPSRCSGGGRFHSQGGARVRGTGQQPGVLADPLVENIPDLGTLLFDELLRLLHRGGQTLGVEPRIDERLEQFARHLLRPAALIQPHFGADPEH